MSEKKEFYTLEEVIEITKTNPPPEERLLPGSMQLTREGEVFNGKDWVRISKNE